MNSETQVEGVLKRVCNALGGWYRVNSEMQMEAVIERIWRCTWTARLTNFRHALGRHDWTSLKMNLEAMIKWPRRCNWRPWSMQFVMHLDAEREWTQRCIWRPWSSKCGNALGGWDWVTSEMQLDPMIVRGWRCTRKSWSSTPWDALRGHDQVSLELYLEAEIELTQRCNWNPWSDKCGETIWGQHRVNSEIHLDALSEEGCKVTSPWSIDIEWVLGCIRNWRRWIGKEVQLEPSLHSMFNLSLGECREFSSTRYAEREMRLAGSRRQSILGSCSTQCMLYSVVTHDHGMQRQRRMTYLCGLRWW